jgi:hypothetical protein
MIATWPTGVRVNQHGETVSVQHQPRDDFRKLMGFEGDFEHRQRVRADRLVPEGSHPDGESAANFFAYGCGDAPLVDAVEIDVCVIALDDIYGLHDVLAMTSLFEAAFSATFLRL